MKNSNAPRISEGLLYCQKCRRLTNHIIKHTDIRKPAEVTCKECGLKGDKIR